MVYVRQEYLPNLKAYKYSAVDRSLVSKYILKPVYNKYVIRLFPASMAPNLVTLTGFMFVVVNILTLLWYSPGLDRDCPAWVYASWAAGLLLYQTFDAVDGIQARRTHQSGPLGELFDHGVDALNTALGVLIFAASQNMGQSWMTVATLFASLLTFYVQTWDQYYTDTLTLGVVSGPVEGVLILCAVYALTALMGGGSAWQRPMLPTLGLVSAELDLAAPLALVRDLSFSAWYMVLGTVVLVSNTYESAANVIRARRGRGGPADRGFGALLGLLPFFGTWALAVAYLALEPAILEGHLVPFAIFCGVVNAYSVGQIATAHLVRLQFPYWNVLNLPLAWAVVDAAGPRLRRAGFSLGVGWPSALGQASKSGGNDYQVAFVFMMLGLAVGVYGSFVVDVIVTICDYLDIWCLTIKHPHVEEEKETSQPGNVGKDPDGQQKNRQGRKVGHKVE